MDSYDHDAEKHRLVVRMPTAVHELFVTWVDTSQAADAPMQ